MGAENLEADLQHFESALAAIIEPVFSSQPDQDKTPRCIAVAYSGGLDSSVLLHLAYAYACSKGVAVYAFHIHHGLSPHADSWLSHCRSQAEQLGIAFAALSINIDQASGAGIESAARTERYQALGKLCRENNVPLPITAHHQDDQAETVLLQLLRGSGIAGLSGMEQANYAPQLLGNDRLLMARPLLRLTRDALQDIATARNIAYVEDASNLDTRYARNALRHAIMPALETHFPGFAQRFARSARHAQSAQRLLVELAAEDLARCTDGDAIDIDRLRVLSDDRSDNLLRYWFGLRGMRMPSTAWLVQMRTQLLHAKADAQILIRHADCDIHRHRNRIFMIPRSIKATTQPEPVRFVWDGSNRMQFANFGGTLYFDRAASGAPGIDSQWLQRQPLILQLRSEGWQLKLAHNRATRSLKYHYQEANVPAWERKKLPLVILAQGSLSQDKSLLYAAGIGMDCKYFSDTTPEPVTLRWEPEM